MTIVHIRPSQYDGWCIIRHDDYTTRQYTDIVSGSFIIEFIRGRSYMNIWLSTSYYSRRQRLKRIVVIILYWFFSSFIHCIHINIEGVYTAEPAQLLSDGLNRPVGLNMSRWNGNNFCNTILCYYIMRARVAGRVLLEIHWGSAPPRPVAGLLIEAHTPTEFDFIYHRVFRRNIPVIPYARVLCDNAPGVIRLWRFAGELIESTRRAKRTRRRGAAVAVQCAPDRNELVGGRRVEGG